MKYITLTFILLLFSHTTYSQNRGVALKSERNDKGDFTIVAENLDYCDYHVVVRFDTGAAWYGDRHTSTVGIGRNIVTTFTKSNSLSGSGYNYKYWVYKGNINEKVNPSFVYALPVKTGDSIQVRLAQSSEYTLMFNLKYASDTVYASRGGIVCDDALSDTSAKRAPKNGCVLIYHKDGSFGQYSSYTKSLVYPGDNVKMGQPIAVVERGKGKGKLVYFSVYFLDKNRVDNEETGLKHSTLIPIFYSANNGAGKLDEKKTYQGGITDDVFIQDMSKREQKKYLKNKGK